MPDANVGGKLRSSFIQHFLLRYGSLVLALFVLCAIFAVTNQHFLSYLTFSTIASSIADLTVLSVGMTFVLILGGIDLAVGSVLALSAAALAYVFINLGMPLWFSFIVSIAVGTSCGLLSGAISTGFKIPSFIVTLGMLEIARGATYQISNSEIRHIGLPIAWVSETIGALGVSPAFLLAVGLVVAGQWILHSTVLGRMCVAIGTNPDTVRMSGISVVPYSLTIFAACGGLSGIAAIIQTSRLEAADPNAGIGMELSAIAACVIGGTSLRGGQGSIVCTFLGVLIVAVLQTGLAQLGITEPIKRMMTGSVIIIAVLVDSLRNRKRS